MRTTKPNRSIRDRRRVLTVETCERRDLMTADALGVFAIQSGIPEVSNSPNRLLFHSDLIRFVPNAQSNTVMLRISSDELTSLGPVSRNTTQNPVHGRAVPSVWQQSSAAGMLLARVRSGSYVLSAGSGAIDQNQQYSVAYQLAGDVDGSFSVTHDDLVMIRTAIFDPGALTPEELANADVDGNGRVNRRDLMLARSNVGASTSVRPISVSTAISDETPHNGMIVRVDEGVFTAVTEPGAQLVFTNGETRQNVVVTADANGFAQAELGLQERTTNRIAVTARDSFGQFVSTSLLVDQRPAPVVILPGYTASLPKSTDELFTFLFQLGYPADKLAVAPAWTVQYGIVNPYTNLQQVLANSGYVEGLDQFLVPYDWRIPVAPYDGVQDGVLSLVTGTSITQAQPQFSLGYFGNFLKNLVLTDPSVVSIDLVGHSNGGLLTRGYIQSLAYGATVSENGQTFTLPTVGNTVLLAAPSMGASEAYPIWNNDLEQFTLASSQTLRLFLSIPYSYVVGGGTITSPLGNIDLATITDPNTGQPDPLKFLRLYGSSLRDLLPTYDFLLTTQGQLTNINSDPSSANNTVLDMNATSSPGVNPWISQVESVTATFGVSPTAVAPVQTSTENQTVVADGTSGQIWPFQLPNPIVPPAGTVYYDDVMKAFGDGTVPYISQVATYAGDPGILVVQWGNGVSGTNPSWTETNGLVLHSPYLNNADVLELVRKRLMGIPV